jgi:hypothetical protein
VKKRIVLVLVVVLRLALPHTTRAQDWATALDKIYMDESHCLVAPEIRSDKDNPISCFCRDAVADARYVYSTYILSGKDRNLNGTFLALQRRAKETCGQNFDQNFDVIVEATESENWKWSGPEVARTYPPDSEIKGISPDSNGFRLVKYMVRLTYLDPQGRVTKVKSFTALDRLPADADSHSFTRTPRRVKPH